MSNQPDLSVEGARAAAERDALDDWVGVFLRSDGSDNADLAARLQTERPYWLGPVRLRFEELNRLAGPPDQPTLERLHDDDLETVEGMADSIDEGWEPAPLVVSLRDDQLVVEDGNHRIEGLRRSGRHNYWAVVGFEHEAERDRFVTDPPHARNRAVTGSG